MHYIWLALIILREFHSPFGIPSIVLTIGINMFLFLDFFIKLQFRDNFSIKTVLILLLPYLFLIVFHPGGALLVINILLCCYLLSDVKIERIVLFNTIFLTSLLAIVFLGIEMGHIQNDRFCVRYKGGEYAYTFGFANTNHTSFMFFQLVLLLYYLGCRYKIVLFHLMCIFISIIIFEYTTARASFYASILLFVMTPFFYSCKFVKKIKNLLIFIPLLSIALLSLSIIFIEHPTVVILDLILSWRLSFFSEFISEFSLLNIFIGKSIPEEMIVDQFFISLFASGGIIAILLFCFLYIKFIKNTSAKNGYMFSVVLVILIFGLVESLHVGLTATSLPLFWLLLYKAAYNKRDVVVKLRQNNISKIEAMAF